MDGQPAYLEVALTLEENNCGSEQVSLEVSGREELVYNIEENWRTPYKINIQEMFTSSEEADCPIVSYEVLDGETSQPMDQVVK